MAWLQTDPSGNHHICFRFGGKKFKRSLRTRDRKKVSRKLVRLEETVDLIESGRIELPSNVVHRRTMAFLKSSLLAR